MLDDLIILLEDYNDYKSITKRDEIKRSLELERKLMINFTNELVLLHSLELLVDIVSHSDIISTISICNNNLSSYAGKLVPAFPTISILTLMGTSLEFSSIQAISDGLKDNTSITDLCLPKNSLGDMGAEILAKSLANNSTITFLDLSANQISANGAMLLCEALVTMPKLKNLYLHTNPLGPKSGTALAHLVENSASLEILDLKNSELANEGAIQLAEGLSKTRSIVTLDLSGNQIEAAGIDAIAVALSTNRSITSLLIARNNIGNTPIEGFSTLLRDNFTLTFIDMNWNGIGSKGASTLSMYLPSNQTLTNLDLAKNRLGDAEMKELSDSLLFTSITNFCLLDNDVPNAEAKNYVKRPLTVNQVCKRLFVGKQLKVLFNNELLPRDITTEEDIYNSMLAIQQEHIKRKQVKVVVLGNSGLGKTTFVQSYANYQKSFWEQLKDKIVRAVSKNQAKPTLGIDETIVNVNKSKLITWDVSGRDESLEWIPLFLSKEAALYLVCYDLSADEETQIAQITKWLNVLAPLFSSPGPRKIILVGMRSDVKPRKKAPLDISRWKDSFPALHEKTFAVSKSDSKSVSKLWHEVTKEGERLSEDLLPIPGRFLTLLKTLNSAKRGIVRQEEFHEHGFGEDWKDHIEKGLSYLHSAGDLVRIDDIVCTKPVLLAKKFASKTISMADLKSITDIEEGSSSAK